MTTTPQSTTHPSAFRPSQRSRPSTPVDDEFLELADDAELTADDVRVLKRLADAGLVPPFNAPFRCLIAARRSLITCVSGRRSPPSTNCAHSLPAQVSIGSVWLRRTCSSERGPTCSSAARLVSMPAWRSPTATRSARPIPTACCPRRGRSSSVPARTSPTRNRPPRRRPRRVSRGTRGPITTANCELVCRCSPPA